MKRTKSSSFEVTDDQAIRLLWDADQLQYFAPFIARDCTVNQAALETHCKPNTMYARVQRYLKLGLLRVVREESRDGRAIKVYRSTADELIVPLEGVWEERANRGWSRFFERAMAHGMRYTYASSSRRTEHYYRNEDSVFSTHVNFGESDDTILSLGPDEPAIHNSLHDAVYLDFTDAKAFQRELFDLTQKYFSRAGAQRYLVRLNLVPVPEEAEVIP